MQATKIPAHQKPISETQRMPFKFKITTFSGLQRKLGKSAKEVKSIIEKFWLD